MEFLIPFLTVASLTSLYSSTLTTAYDPGSNPEIGPVMDFPAPNSIRLFIGEHLRGLNVTIGLNGCEICKLVPRKFQNKVESIEPNFDGCIQVHENWDCTGQSLEVNITRHPTRLAVPMPRHYPLKSLSACRSVCHVQPYVLVRSNSPPGAKTITIFDEPKYKGNSKELNLSLGCVEVGEDWEKDLKSLDLFNECVIIHGTHGCVYDFENLTYHEMNYTNTWAQAKFPIPWPVKSVQLCNGLQINNTPPDNDILKLLLLSVCGILVVSLGGSVFKITRLKQKVTLTKNEMDEFKNGSPNNDSIGQNMPFDPTYEIPRSELRIDQSSKLGSGCFGEVYKGTLTRNGGEETVAVKIINSFQSSVLKEIKVMIHLENGHDRIVHFIGCITDNLNSDVINGYLGFGVGLGELYLMMELCENGCLETFLVGNSMGFQDVVEAGPLLSVPSRTVGLGVYKPIFNPFNFNTSHLLNWSLQIAEGMEFLSTKRVVHIDLATRNVLLDAKFNTKIADFGLSRKLYQNPKYIKAHQTGLLLPWAWLAIESLESLTFSAESDVWAYGVTVWEIFSLGQTPSYPSMDKNNLKAHLETGNRLPRPDHASEECYDLMLECWKQPPTDRITFLELITRFSDIIERNVQDP